MGWIKRIATATALVLGISQATAEARGALNLQYAQYLNPLTSEQEVALKIPIHKGISYNILATLYTGNANHTNVIKAFNSNKKLLYDPKIKRYVYIPVAILKPSLIKIFQENKWTRFEIDNQGDEGIANLWQISKEFLKGYDIAERVNILLAINDDINPIGTVVHNGQRILVPESLVDDSKIEKDEGKSAIKTSPVKLPTAQTTVPRVQTNVQNPLKFDIKKIIANMEKKDRYGVGRLRTSNKGFRASIHEGIDLRAHQGTKVYPIKPGIVIQAGEDRLWRNGISITYKTDDGLEVKYIHLKKVNKELIGKRVDTNTILGEVGQTGNATYPHVHVQIKEGGRVINPTPYVLADPG